MRLRRRREGGSSAGVTSGGSQLRNVPRRTLFLCLLPDGLEAAAKGGDVKMADAALVENRNGEALVLQRQSHHGWAEGAVDGAV